MLKFSRPFILFLGDFCRKHIYTYACIVFLGGLSASMQVNALLFLQNAASDQAKNIQYLVFHIDLNKLTPYMSIKLFLISAVLSFVFLFFQNKLIFHAWRAYQTNCAVELLKSLNYLAQRVDKVQLSALQIKPLLKSTQRIGAFVRIYCNFTSYVIQSITIVASLLIMDFSFLLKIFVTSVFPVSFTLLYYARRSSRFSRDSSKLTKQYNGEIANSIEFVSLADNTLQTSCLRELLPVSILRARFLTEKFQSSETARLIISTILISTVALYGLSYLHAKADSAAAVQLANFLILAFVALRNITTAMASLAGMGRFFPYLQNHFNAILLINSSVINSDFWSKLEKFYVSAAFADDEDL